MTPAMVELRSPAAAAASPQLKPQRSQSQNPSKGQIFASPPPPLFDRSSISSVNRVPGASTGSMDPANLPPPAPDSGKPSPAARLLKPRLTKVRKHLASSRVREATVPDGGPGTGFNPFRSGPSITDPPDRTEHVRARLYTWNPSVPEARTGVSESSTRLNSGNLESLKSQSGGFVFGAGSSDPKNVASGEGSGNSDTGAFLFGSGMNKSSNLSRNSSESSIGLSSGSFESIKSESSDFVFGANTKNDELRNTVGGTFGSASVGSGNSDQGVFAFGSGLKGSTNFSRNSALGSVEGSLSWLRDEVSKLNLQSTDNEDQADHRSKVAENNTFNFGGSKNALSEGSGNSDAGVFVSGSAVKKSSNLSQSSSFGSDEASFSHLPDELRKLNLQSAGNVAADGFEKSEQADCRPEVDRNNTFISGSSKSASSEGIRNPDPGVFVFGSGVKSSSNLSRNPSLGSDEVSFSWLPDEMRKLNMQSTSNDDGFQKSKQADCRPEIDKNSTFVFGGSKNVPGEQSGNPTPCVFVFGSGVKNGLDTSQNTSLDSDEVSFSRLPDEMRKLNLQSAGSEDSFRKTKNDNFIFGGSNNVPSSSGGSASNKMPEEKKKLNIGSERSSQNRKDESVDFAAGVFVFGSNSKTSSVSSQTSSASFTSVDKSTTLELPDDIKKPDAQGSRNDFSFKNTGDSDSRHKVDVSSGFVYGSSKNASVSFGGAADNTLSDDMRKLNIGSKTENSFGSVKPGFLPDGSTTGEPTPFKFAFSFQVGKQDHHSNMDPIPQSQTRDHIRPSSGVTLSSHPSSPCPCFQSVGTDITFTGMREGLDTTHMEFRTQKQDTFCFSKENLYTDPHRSMVFSMKEEAKGTKPRKMRGKSRQSTPVSKQFISREKVSLENPELDPSGDYSPMDYSPYQENLVADQCSRETSAASDESIHLASCTPSSDSHKSVSMDGREEDLVSAAQNMDINDCDLKHRELDEDGSKDHAERNFASGFSFVDERTSGLGNGSLTPEYENVGLDSDSRAAATEAETGIFSSNIEREAGEGGTLFTSASSLEDKGVSNFTFATSPSIRGPLSALKRNYRRKSRMRAGQDSYSSTSNTEVPLASPTPNLVPVTSTSVHPDPPQGPSGIPFVPPTENDSRSEKNRKPEVSQDSVTTSAASIAAQEACERWRFRGNQAYADGYLSKAEDYYTRGVNSVSLNEPSRSGIRALMLCYSNRAATRMSLGRMREAISDCKMALAIDPNFLRARVRAANCHLALGEIEDALKHFKKCMQSENDINCDQKILIEASEGLKKAQQVADCMDQSVELLLKRTTDDATKALQIISEGLSISPHSESLMEMKAEALLMLRSYEEVVQLCEMTLDSAEKNSVITGDYGQLKDVNSSEYRKISLERLWRWRLISKSYFYLGKLEEALELLQKHEKVKPIADKFGYKSQEDCTSLSVTIGELLRLKAAGNEAFQAGRHSEAVEHYTSALACNTESRPFAAICFCNRAAAYQATGQITDAIADCSLAIALDSSYPKAISRRATLHEMIRDNGQAANDLNRLISLLEKQSEETDSISGTPVRSTGNCSDLKRARVRLSTVEEEAIKGTPLDMYSILGIEPTSSAADVKKAYRKAALRHHPDKAGHFLTRSENVNDGLWREVAAEVHTDADRLFKMIGEAYTVLSDTTKRLQYDAEEEIRTTMKGYNGSGTTKTSSDYFSSKYERSFNRHQWRAYGSPDQRRSYSSRSNK